MNQWRKGIASWKVGNTLYISVPFTWLMANAEEMAKQHKGKVLIGGPGTAQPSECPGFSPLLFHNPCATFTTRGCPNNRSFCAVPKIEGEFREMQSWRPAPVICDNNLLAATDKHFYKVIDSLRQFPACDFNQGLDARLFRRDHASQIATLNHPMVRFSFDHVNHETKVHDAIEISRSEGLRDFGVYVLFGYKDTPEDALYRLNKVREWGVFPNPMRYQPLDATEKNAYVADGWTEKELRKMMKYYSRLSWLEHIPYGDFDYLKYDKAQGVLL